MAQVVADRVRDTTTTTGTGAVTVSGTPPTTYKTFSARCTIGDTLAYFIAHQTLDEWECGVATYSASNQLTRTTVLSSSNSDAAVSFSAGTKDVVLTQIANRCYQQTGFTGLSHTVTTSVPALDLSQTWNSGAVAFTAIKMNVTNTASDAASLLADLQVSGASKFNVKRNGALTVAGPLVTNSDAINTPDLLASGILAIHPSAPGTGVGIWPTWSFGWSINPGVASVTPSLNKDADDILAQRNGANPNAYRLYNTYTNTSNFERGGFDWISTSNVFRIRSEDLGTGTNRIIAIDGFAKAGAAVAGDIPSGTWALVRDTSGSTTKLIYNNAGTLMTVALT